MYGIQALNEHGASPVSGHANTDTPAAPVPDKPTGLTGTVTHDSVSLSWDDPDDDSITGYRILRRNRATDDPGLFHSIEDDTGAAVTSYTDTGVEPENRYVYRIRAINAQGLSKRSSWFNADTPEAPAETPEPALPAAPTGLLTAATHDQVLLSWDDPDDDSITGYRILRGPDADSLAVIVENTNSASTSHTDQTVEPETDYVYAVRALNASKAGEPSESVGATTLQAPEEQNTARQTTGVCDRTDEVENAIVAAVSGVTTCGAITTTHLGGILSLDLFNKGISSLQSGDFDGLTALTTLNLTSNNDLESLPADIFNGLTGMTHLDLSGNDLESLPADVFDGLTALTTLDLRNNDLESLPAGVFDGLTALTTLRFTSNSLESLPAGVFDELTALETLDLDSNALTSLPAGVFDGLTALVYLQLFGNALTSLPEDVFDGLTALESLTLDNNSLESLPAGVFDELTALEFLYLNDNPGSADFIPTARIAPVHFTPGDTVTLDGSGSGGPWGANVSYAWVQTGGPTVNLTGADTGAPTFTAPNSELELVFTLTVTGRGLDDNDSPYTDSATARMAAGVCGRTDEVEAAIIAAVSGVTACGAITTTHLGGILSLDLVDKGISSLQSGDFAGLTGMTTLTLHGNSLESLPADVFNGLTALTTLDLSWNSLTSLPADVFDGLTALTTLDLGVNSLETLPADVFDELTALTTLELHGNALENLPATVFDTLTALTTLRLNSNAINSISDGAFNRLANLRTLDLWGNNLTSLPEGIFDKLTALTILQLDRNSLTRLPAGIFDNLTALERLDLQDNQLTSLSAVVFQHLTALEELDLSRNQITSLPDGIFERLTALESLQLLVLQRRIFCRIPDALPFPS